MRELLALIVDAVGCDIDGWPTHPIHAGVVGGLSRHSGNTGQGIGQVIMSAGRVINTVLAAARGAPLQAHQLRQ
jgi:hypothetical protein